MGTFKFTWDHPAEEVYVTGTFDNWCKSVQLDKVGDGFQKTVTLPDASKKIYYKFVADGTWLTDHTAPQEPDHEGNVNNFLTPEQIMPEEPSAVVMNTVTPTSTTAVLAGAVPLEKEKEKEPEPVAEPEAEPTAEPAAEPVAEPEPAAEPMPEPKVEAEAAPTPSDVPGGFPITPAADLDQPIGIDPKPATDGAVNPPAGHVATGDIQDNVKLDPESYEKSDALPGVKDGELPPSIAADADKPVGIHPLPAAEGGLNPIKLAPGEPIPPALLSGDINEHVKLDEASYEASDALPGIPTLPPVTDNMIPESSLPIASPGDVHINTVTPESTTAALAAAVPLEAKVPEVVKESQEKAHADPEASAVPEEVEEKAAVEKELLSKVPTAPPAAEGTSTGAEVSPEVPAEVKESIAEAGAEPEAAANTEAVEEKKAVEAELLQEVKPVEAEASKAVETTTAPAETTAAAAETTEAPAETTEAPAETEKAAETAETPAAAANGAETPAAVTNNGASSRKPAETPATPDKKQKKKNRVSGFFSKLKHKLSDK